MVARALHHCGLYLGDERDLMNPGSDNPDGFWEHLKFVEINDAILSVLGGAWDWPPCEPGDWDESRLSFLRERAAELSREFDGRPYWGWKDPRNCLTLPFWSSLLPDLRVVVVVRNPLEVATSLRRRNSSSYALGLALWTLYNQRLLTYVRSHEYIVTQYDAYFRDPVGELRRIIRFLGLPASEDTLKVGAVVDSDRRHTTFSADELRAAGASPVVLRLYSDLMARAEESEAGAENPGDGEAQVDGFAPLGQHDRSFVEAGLLRADLEKVQRNLEAHQETVRALQKHLKERTEWARQLAQERRVLASRLADEAAAREQTARQTQEERDRHADEVQRLLAAYDRLEEAAASVRPLTDRIRRIVAGCVPLAQTVLVVNRGDDALLKLDGHTARPFPQGPDGGYAGYYPESSDAAIQHLEALRDSAHYLVLPSTAFWWLDHYTAFRDYLETCCGRVWADAACIVYDLSREPAP